MKKQLNKREHLKSLQLLKKEMKNIKGGSIDNAHDSIDNAPEEKER